MYNFKLREGSFLCSICVLLRCHGRYHPWVPAGAQSVSARHAARVFPAAGRVAACARRDTRARAPAADTCQGGHHRARGAETRGVQGAAGGGGVQRRVRLPDD